MMALRMGMFLGLCLGVGAVASAERRLVDLRVFPDSVALTTKRAVQQIVVQAVYDDTVTRDVTAEAVWSISDESKVRRDGAQLKPLADGEAKVTIAFGGKQQVIPVSVARAGEDRPSRIPFGRDACIYACGV